MKALYFYIVKYSLFISFDRRDLVLYNVLVIHGFYLVLLESFKKVTLSLNTDEVLLKLNSYYLAIEKIFTEGKNSKNNTLLRNSQTQLSKKFLISLIMQACPVKTILKSYQ